MAANNRDLEQAIAKDASDFIRELEVERIIRAFKLKCVVPLSCSCSDLAQ